MSFILQLIFFQSDSKDEKACNALQEILAIGYSSTEVLLLGDMQPTTI